MNASHRGPKNPGIRSESEFVADEKPLKRDEDFKIQNNLPRNEGRSQRSKRPWGED